MFTPPRSGPGGCIIMLTGLAALIYGLLAGFAIWKLNHSADPAKFEELAQSLKWHCGVSTVLGFTLVVLGWRFANRVRTFHADDD